VMRHVLLLLALCSVGLNRAADFYEVTDPVTAEYEGFWTSANGAKGRITAQIRPLSNNRYEGFVLLLRSRSPVAAFTLAPAVLENDLLKFAGSSSAKEAGGDLLGRNEVKCEFKGGKFTGSFSGELGEGTLEGSKVDRHPPSLGAKPPRNAIVLLSPTETNGWENLTWPMTGPGVLQVGKGNIQAKEKLTNYRLHLEFRTPYMPLATGQARGNSGVYLQSKYEVQVLDSFGLYPLQDNDCGGIYKVHAPLMNATLPPTQWQTYDITYVSGNAERGETPTITVVLNGLTVIEKTKVPADLVEKGTGGGNANSGFLLLQDHGNPVQFRNIWAEPFFSQTKKR